MSYKHYSYNSCSEIRQLFQKIFPDSSIAQTFTFGKTKASYNISHGLAPYFHELVYNSVLHFDSSFLGHASANDLQSGFTSLLNDQILSKIVQVLMDGPNVNLKFLDQLINELEIQSEKSLLDMGSCGLHVVHGHKNIKWNVNTAL